MRGSDLLVQSLVQAGVKYVFGMPGHTTLPILDSISREPSIRFILAKHENTLISMADGYARVSLEPGVCLTPVGPSAANLLNGMGSAFRESSPVIAITCNEEQSRLDRDEFNGWDQLTPFRSITKWSVQARSAKDIPRIMRSAFVRSRLGRRGPVQVDVPLDVAAEELGEVPAVKKPAYESYSSRVSPDRGLTGKIVDQLLKASRPLILAGAGVNWSEANAELLQFAELTGLPVAVTAGGRGAFPETHPQFAGVPGRAGNRATSEALKESNFVLGIGCRFSDVTTGNWSLIDPAATIAQVDIDPAEIARQYAVDIGVIADCKMFFQCAIELAGPLVAKAGGSPAGPQRLQVLTAGCILRAAGRCARGAHSRRLRTGGRDRTIRTGAADWCAGPLDFLPVAGLPPPCGDPHRIGSPQRAGHARADRSAAGDGGWLGASRPQGEPRPEKQVGSNCRRARWAVVRLCRRPHARHRPFGHRDLDRPAGCGRGDTDIFKYPVNTESAYQGGSTRNDCCH